MTLSSGIINIKDEVIKIEAQKANQVLCTHTHAPTKHFQGALYIKNVIKFNMPESCTRNLPSEKAKL